MRFVLLAIVLAFPVADLYVTARLARWSGIPLWIWLTGSFVAGALLLRNERLAFRTRTVAALHGEQSLMRGLRRQRPQGARRIPADVPGHPVRPAGAHASRAAAQCGAPLRGAAAGAGRLSRTAPISTRSTATIGAWNDALAVGPQ